MPTKGVGKNAKPATVKRGGKSARMGDTVISPKGKTVGAASRYRQADGNASVQPQSGRK